MMYRDEQEVKEAVRRMGPKAKAEYILHYYWWAFLLGIIAIAVAGSVIHRQLTKKQPVLYMSWINVTIGSELDEKLTQDYLTAAGMDPKKQEVLVYRNMIMTEDESIDHQVVYATRLKTMATINGKLLDMVLMNEEAWDNFSNSGYLLDLGELQTADAGLYGKLEPLLRENTVILEDNRIEVDLNEAETYEAVTMEAVNGIEISSLPPMSEAGLSGAVYLGIIANTPRLSECCDYLSYLLSLGQSSDQKKD